MLNKIKAKKHIILMVLAPVALVGFLFVQNVNVKKPPQIDAISPAIGLGDNLITITGSGFTTGPAFPFQWDAVRIRRASLPNGNYLRLAGAGTMGPPSFSSDGKTLKFQLALNETQVPKNCVPGTTGPKCQISLQVVNGEGIPSNIAHFQIYIPTRPLVVSMSLDSQNPTAQNIAAGAKDIEVLRFKVKASADNPVNFDIPDFIVKILPTDFNGWGGINCDDFSNDVKITDASTGELVGSQWYYSLFGTYVAPTLSVILREGASCPSTVPTWLPLSPGQERTLSVKLSLAPQAKAGLQFRIAADKIIYSIYTSIEGADLKYDKDWGIGYAEVTSNLITIVAP